MGVGPAGGAAGTGRYRFDDIVVDEAAHSLLRAGEVQPIEPKAFAVLLALLRRPGVLVGRDVLLDRVWGHRHVTPGVLTRAIAQLRSALGDDPQQPRYIQTRHALGYCFIGRLLPGPDDGPEGDATAESGPRPPPAPGPEAGDGGGGPQVAATAPPAAAREHASAAGWNGPMDATQPARAWSPRAWYVAAALAVVLLAAVLWSRRQEAPPLPAEASIAILPFASLSSDRDDDYFAEGLAVEMHDALAGVDGLKVAAQMSPAAAAGLETDVKALGALLGVATVLDASVRREGKRVRINARLSDCGTGYTLWSRSYDRELSDVFAIQSEIANEVVQSLVGVIPGQREAIARRLTPTKSALAFDAYLRGLQRLRRGESKVDAEDAIAFFEEALQADDGLVRAQLGICRTELWRFNNLREAAALERAGDACAKAGEMDPGSRLVDLLVGDVHRYRGELAQARERYGSAKSDPALLADVYLREGVMNSAQGRVDAAVADFERARLLRPGDATIVGMIARQQSRMGRTDDAIASYLEASRLRPEDAEIVSSLAGLYIMAGRYEDAVQAFDHSLSIKPTDLAYYNYGVLMLQLGDYRKSADMFRNALAIEDGSFLTWGALGDALLAGRLDESEVRESYRRAARMAEEYLAVEPGDAFALASSGWYSAMLGDEDLARRRALAAEAAGSQKGKVALLNAQTFTRIGTPGEVAARLSAARSAGLPESLIAGNPFIRDPAAADASRKARNAVKRRSGDPTGEDGNEMVD